MRVPVISGLREHVLSRIFAVAWRSVAAAVSLSAIYACESPGDASHRGADSRPPTAVVAATAQVRPFTDNYTALGTARARESVELTSRVSSLVAEINFSEGQWVKSGELLVTLDNREIRAQRDVAAAALSKVRSQYERASTLTRTRVVSEAELEELAADMQRAEADLQAAQARLDDTYIRAPFAGYVGLRKVSVGDLVGPDTVITTLDDTTVIRLEFSLPEAYLANVKPGLPVATSSQVFPDKSFTGKLVNLDSRIDPVTRSVTAVADIPNPENLLKPGMFMTVAVQRTRDAVILIPEEALVPRQGRQYVYVVRDGRARELEVVLGARAPGLAEVREGLQGDEQVIIEGAHKLRDGGPVTVVPRAG